MDKMFIKRENNIIQEMLILIMEEFGRFLKLVENDCKELEQLIQI